MPVFIRIEGIQHYLWPAVDQEGVVLDILVQPRRDAKAAKRFFRRLQFVLRLSPSGARKHALSGLHDRHNISNRGFRSPNRN